MTDVYTTEKVVALDTRARILDAAGRVFAESGYRGATVREICRRAGANIAAVNYHFRDKRSLYFETLRYWHAVAFRKYPPHVAADGSRSPGERLSIFITQFLSRMLDEGESSWFGKLMAWEYIEATEGLDIVVEEAIRPLFTLLSGIVRELIGDDPPAETVRLCSTSVVGQCLYFVYARPVVARLFPDGDSIVGDKDRIAAHIIRFSLDAIRARAEVKGGDQL